MLALGAVFEKGGTTSEFLLRDIVWQVKRLRRLVGDRGYQKHRYNSFFVGMAPVSDPRFVVTVIIHDPQGKKYLGGQVSGPVFQKIMEATLRMLDVPPDAL